MTTQLQTYTNYKDSEIDWLGNIPAHWEDNQLKRVCKLIKDGTHASFSRVDKGYPLLSVRNIVNNEFINLKDDSYISKEDYLSITKSFKVEEGDIQLAIVGATMGKVAIVKKLKPFATQRSIATIRVDKKYLLNNYLFYFIQGNKFQSFLWNNTSYSAQPGIYLNTIQSITVPLPPKNEQAQIAAYLDQKTTVIDKKIRLLEKKITHYTNYRKSLINEVVTGKRLVQGMTTISITDDDTKDSCIPWIGKIPKHWEVKRLKDYFSMSKGINANKYNKEYLRNKNNLGKYPVYSGQTENNGLMASINTYEYDFHEKVFIITTVGAKAMDIKRVSGKFTLSQNCALFNSKNDSVVDYQYFYLTQLFKEERKIIPTIMQPSLRIEDLKKYFILYPPKKEQQQIATYLDKKNETIDVIIANLKTQITTLQELRKTLINDVVTGKVSILHTDAAQTANTDTETS